MTRTLLPAALLATALLAGCGTATGVEANDPADTSSPSASATPTPSPTSSPEPGTYPAYPFSDYSYTLKLQCFCASFGKPIRISVADGEVTSAAWARDGQGTVKGEEVTDEWARLTMDDVIDAANDTEAEVVEVEWEAGADHPTRVSVDRDLQSMDEEITYVVSDVLVSS